MLMLYLHKLWLLVDILSARGATCKCCLWWCIRAHRICGTAQASQCTVAVPSCLETLSQPDYRQGKPLSGSAMRNDEQGPSMAGDEQGRATVEACNVGSLKQSKWCRLFTLLKIWTLRVPFRGPNCSTSKLNYCTQFMITLCSRCCWYAQCRSEADATT